MPTRNFDSSLLTQRRQAKALAAFYTNVVAGGTTLKREQTNNQTATVVTERNLGKCYCSTDATANPYDFNPSNCGCTK
jgi:hypothetical protein